MKKLRKILKVTLIAVGALVALALIVNAVLVWITGSRLEAKLRALREAGDPVALQDLARPPIPADQNAATYLRRAQDDIKAINKELAPVYERMSKANDKPSAEDNKAIRAALAAYPRLFPLLEQAAACPDSNSDPDCTSGTQAFLSGQLRQVQDLWRGAVHLLAERSRLEVLDGQRDEALHDAVTILRLGRHLGHEPMLITHLVVCACQAAGVDAANRALRSGPVSAKVGADLDAELARADSSAAYVQSLKGERAYGLEACRNDFPIFWVNRAYWNNDECFYLDLIAQNIALTSQTYAEARQTLLRMQVESQSWLHPMSRSLIPALGKVNEADIRTRALVRCLRVLNALQQRPASPGATQPKLEDLGLPVEATIDPFNGSPLHLKMEGGGWIIYATGTNLIDDGGQLEERKDVGLGPVAGKEK
jgi:HAMP domain-containing protein